MESVQPRVVRGDPVDKEEGETIKRLLARTFEARCGAPRFDLEHLYG
jgi:hypothetical protein